MSSEFRMVRPSSVKSCTLSGGQTGGSPVISPVPTRMPYSWPEASRIAATLPRIVRPSLSTTTVS